MNFKTIKLLFQKKIEMIISTLIDFIIYIKKQLKEHKMTEFIRELKRTIGGPYDPLIIKLNRHMFYEDRDLGGIFCGSGVKIDLTLFDEGIGFQHPRMRSYNKIKRITLKIKHARVEFI